jgi:uncharacterized protein (DUF488 family)
MTSVYTIGHSNHTIERLLALLRQHDIAVLADVRSTAFSRYNPQFNAGPLQASLAAAGIRYERFQALGGKPDDADLLQADGTPDYDRIEATPGFRQALLRLMEIAATARVAIMCSEADPNACHRERLIAPALRRAGVEVRHILADGSLAKPPDQGAFDF